MAQCWSTRCGEPACTCLHSGSWRMKTEIMNQGGDCTESVRNKQWVGKNDSCCLMLVMFQNCFSQTLAWLMNDEKMHIIMPWVLNDKRTNLPVYTARPWYAVCKPFGCRLPLTMCTDTSPQSHSMFAPHQLCTAHASEFNQDYTECR